MNSQLRKSSESDQSASARVEEYKPSCDLAVNAFKEAIGSIDSEIVKTKGLANVEEQEDGDGLQ